MRDTSVQLTRIEQVGVWVYTTRAVRYLVILLAGLPLLPIVASIQHGRDPSWSLGVVILLGIPISQDWKSRTELTSAQNRRVLESQLTGRSTGDPRLDAWVVQRATPAADLRRRHPWRDWLTVGLIGASLIALDVAAGVVASPWWLLCSVTLPLFFALPIAHALADPLSVVEILTPTKVAVKPPLEPH